MFLHLNQMLSHRTIKNEEETRPQQDCRNFVDRHSTTTTMRLSKNNFRFVWRLFKRIMFHNLRYPCYKQEFIQQHLLKLTVSRDELNEYLSVSDKRAPYLLILSLLYAIYAIRGIVLAGYTITIHDQGNAEANIMWFEDMNRRQNLAHYACFVTNCSRLSARPTSSTLASDFSLLPITPLCHPILAVYYEPIIWLGSSGIPILTITAYCLFILGSAFIMQNYFYPKTSQLIMYIVAPNVGKRLLYNRFIGYLDEVNTSLANTRMLYEHIMETNLARRESRNSTQITNYSSDELLPAIRSNWWLSIIIDLFTRLTILWVLSMIFINSIYLLYIVFGNDQVKTLMNEYWSTTIANNCSIWYDSKNVRANQIVLLNQINIEWTLFHAIMPIFTYTISIFCASIATLSYYLTYSDLICWIEELKFQVRMATELIRLNLTGTMRVDATIRYNRTHIAPKKRLLYTCPSNRTKLHISILREIFVASAKLNFFWDIIMVPVKRIDKEHASNKIDAKIAEQQLALNLITAEEWQGRKSYIKLAEQLYASFRSLLSYSREFAPCFAEFIFLCHFLDYGLVLIVIFYKKTMSGLSYESVCIVVLAWLLSSVLIFLASNYHATAKKLHPIIWSFIAALHEYDDIEMNHIRSLWVKQMHVLESDGGLIIKSFRMRVTYLNIIQLVIWTATLVLLIMGRG